MTINKIKADLEALRAIINIKQALPWDCKSLMMQFNDEKTRRDIYKILCGVKEEYYEEPGPITLCYSNFQNLPWQALKFINMSDEERAAAYEKEFPPKQYTEEEAEETRSRLMAKINGIGERMRHKPTAD